MLNFSVLCPYSFSLIRCDISFTVAFDEDFEAELQDNFDAKTEVSLLAKSADPELTEVIYLNIESWTF